MKPKIINTAYVWDPGYRRLRHCGYEVREPWRVLDSAKPEHFTAGGAVRAWTDESHTELLLTVKLGPCAGTTSVTCTCGWDRTFKTRIGAIRSLNQHRKLNGLPKTDHWNG